MMTFTSCTQDLQNDAPLELKAIATTTTATTTTTTTAAKGDDGPQAIVNTACYCYIQFAAPTGLPTNAEWNLDDTSTGGTFSTPDFQGFSFGIFSPNPGTYGVTYFPLSSTGNFDFELSLSDQSLPPSFSLDAVVKCVHGGNGVDISTGTVSRT